MRPHDIPRQEHKDWNEIFQFQWFLSSMPELEAADFRKSETPDFLLQLDGRSIGIEHTLYYSDQSLLKFEKETKQIIERAQLMFEEATGIPVNVAICWNDSHWKSVNRDEKSLLPQAISDFVKEHFLPEQISSFDWRYLYQTGLDKWIAYLDIRHLRSQTEALWAASYGGAMGGVSDDQLKHIIAHKDEKYDDCKRHCDECWLLIYGTSAGMSSVILYDESVANLSKLEFDSKFQRVFFFDGWTKRSIELQLKA